MKAILLKYVKKGAYFTIRPIEEPTEKQVYIREDFCRDIKRYECSKYADVCSCSYWKGDKIVYVDFIF